GGLFPAGGGGLGACQRLLVFFLERLGHGLQLGDQRERVVDLEPRQRDHVFDGKEGGIGHGDLPVGGEAGALYPSAQRRGSRNTTATARSVKSLGYSMGWTAKYFQDLTGLTLVRRSL